MVMDAERNAADKLHDLCHERWKVERAARETAERASVIAWDRVDDKNRQIEELNGELTMQRAFADGHQVGQKAAERRAEFWRKLWGVTFVVAFVLGALVLHHG